MGTDHLVRYGNERRTLFLSFSRATTLWKQQPELSVHGRRAHGESLLEIPPLLPSPQPRHFSPYRESYRLPLKLFASSFHSFLVASSAD